MTPKIRANELAIKFCSSSDVFKPNLRSIRMALICVEEILNNDGFTEFDIYLTEYWNEVKNELEKLK